VAIDSHGEDVGVVRDAMLRFSNDRPRYEKLSSYVGNIVSKFCFPELIHTMEHRAKSKESFERKCNKKNEDGSYKYDDPLNELTDLAGVRAIVYLRDSVELVSTKIREKFEKIEEIDVGERVFSEGRFGYQSKHFLVKLKNDRADLEENHDIAGLTCEIQVRTMLQHAWAVIDHKIQYKANSEIPLEIRKRFSALAGALELADRELQRVEEDSQALRNEIQKDLARDLTHQSLQQNTSELPSKIGDSDRIKAARSLIGEASYAAAISLYTDKIRFEPSSYTLYLGRAKARFLSGDPNGAFSDLELAANLKPGDPVGARLKAIFESGEIRELTENVTAPEPSLLTTKLTQATSALAAGDGVAAFDLYSELEGVGYNKAFARFGMAMSCLLEGDYEGCQSYLSFLRVIPSTPMSVNLTTMRFLIAVMDSNQSEAEKADVVSSLSSFPDFHVRSSPLHYLLEGAQKKESTKWIDAIKVLCGIDQFTQYFTLTLTPELDGGCGRASN
jgi:ppGpp synthetase/RelA/SpoT-type nucleotidyltranferase